MSSGLAASITALQQKEMVTYMTAWPLNPYHWDVPPLTMPSSMTSWESKTHWYNSINTGTGGYDPVSLLMTYSIQKYPRYDGEVEQGVVVTMKLYNFTPVPIWNCV